MTVETQEQFKREEQAYWEQRDELMQKYAGKWVAIVGGEVVAVGDRMNKAAAEALRRTKSAVMFVTRVGQEDLEFRVREVTAGYFDYARDNPLPMVRAGVSDPWEAERVVATFMVDTGADISVLTSDLADALGLREFLAAWARVSGFDGKSEDRPLYNALVHVDGRPVIVTADCREDVRQNILGRDVINEFALTVCAKRDEVEFEWVEE